MVTKIEREAADIINAYGSNLSQDHILKLESCTKTLKMKQKHLAELDDQILAQCDLEEIEKEVEESTEVSSKIEVIVLKIEKCRIGLARNGTTETVTTQDTSTQDTSAQDTSTQGTSTQGTSAQGTSAQGTSVQGMSSQIQNVFTPCRLKLLTENSPSG